MNEKYGVYKILKCADNIQQRTIRYFLSLLIFTSLAVWRGRSIGWHKTHCNRWANRSRLLNTLIRILDTRLTYNVFECGLIVG